jgi:predicted transcriptional regulator
MTPAQCRAARALIDMTQAELAGHAAVTTTLIADYEAGVVVGNGSRG